MADTRLAAGGLLSWNVGHYDVTFDALRALRFSKDGANVAADASQDPDFYEFNHPAAHAQTPNDDRTGVTSCSRAAAEADYLQWVSDRVQSLVQAAPADPKDGLFLLGYVLHGVQDLAVHQGITNAQHSYLSYKDKGDSTETDPVLDPMLPPDKIEARITKAREFTAAFLERFGQRYPAVLTALRAYPDSWVLYDRLDKGRKARLLGVAGWDMDCRSVRTYRALSPLYFAVRRQAGCGIADTTWDRDAVFARLLDRL